MVVAIGALQSHLRHAYDRAPAVRQIFNLSRLLPEDINNFSDLAKLSITKKDDLVALQAQNPPFGGFLAAPMNEVARIFVSPGPIFDPQFNGTHGGAQSHDFRAAIDAAGIGPGDIVLNTWGYQLVPAGLLVDESFQQMGATVVPSGTGNTELQLELIEKLGVTVICASTRYFIALAQALEDKGLTLPRDWQVRAAFVGGEIGDWMALRRQIENRYGIETFAAYCTGEFGLIGYEAAGLDGYVVSPQHIVQICDPETGALVADGDLGEVVVTSLHPGYPLLRLGTGDLARSLETVADGGAATRLSILEGRVGQAVKVREIFVYPQHIESLKEKVKGVVRICAAVTRAASREEISLTAELLPGLDAQTIKADLRQKFREISRVSADHVEIVPPGHIGKDVQVLSDLKQLSA